MSSLFGITFFGDIFCASVKADLFRLVHLGPKVVVHTQAQLEFVVVTLELGQVGWLRVDGWRGQLRRIFKKQLFVSAAHLNISAHGLEYASGRRGAI